MSAKNLDVVRRSRLEPKGCATESAPDRLLSGVCPFPAPLREQREQRGRYRPLGSKYISVPQATNLIEAVNFAKSIDLPLVATSPSIGQARWPLTTITARASPRFARD